MKTNDFIDFMAGATAGKGVCTKEILWEARSRAVVHTDLHPGPGHLPPSPDICP